MLRNQTNQDGSMSQKKPVDKKATLFRVRWVSVAIVSAILTLSGWALSSPIGSSPDDDYHLANIWCGQGFREGLCEKDINPIFIKVPATTFSNSVCFQFDEDKSGACPYDNSLKPFPRSNAVENLYPPLYYWSMSWLATKDIAASTIAMRITNSILAVLTFSLVILLLPHHLRRVPLVSLLVSALPLGVFLIASTNPSSWAYFSIIIFFSSFLGFLNSDTYRTKWIFGSLSAVSLMLAAGSRPDAAIYAVIAIGLAILLNLSKKLFSPVNVVTSLAFVTASAYSYLSIGIGQAVVSGGLALPDQESPAPSFFVNLASLPNLWIGVFGTSGLGWLDTEMPAIVWAVTLSIYTGLIFSSVRWFSFKQSVAVSLAFLALVIIPLYILTVSGLSVGQQVQPRYLLPLIALLGAASLYRISSASGLELTRSQAWIIGAGLFVANTMSLHLNARRYITGMDQQGVNLDKDIEWWWSHFALSPNIVWLSGSVAFAVFLVSIWKLRTELGLPGDVKKIPSPAHQI
jgi:hypothetical protein